MRIKGTVVVRVFSLMMALGAIQTNLGPFSVSSAFGLPRYSARYEQKCSLCHVNPTGGGMRTTYASQFLVPTEMVYNPWGMGDIEKINPHIADRITIGADLRTIARYSDEDALRSENGFFHMQSDFYLSFQGDDHWSAYLDRGSSTTYEAFGMAQVLPHNGYVKVGRFTPAFGWKLADHNAFTREVLGFEPPAHTDVGVEVGLYPGNTELHLSLLNGNQGATQDFNDELSFAARGAWRFHLKGTGVTLGGSYQSDDDRSLPSDEVRERNTGGPFGAFHWDRFTWLGEADWTRWNLPESDEEITTFITSHEAAFQVRQGLDLVGTFSFHDPDLDLQSGTEARWGAGINLFLNPFAVLSLLVQTYVIDEPDGSIIDPALSRTDYTQTVVQGHFLY